MNMNSPVKENIFSVLAQLMKEGKVKPTLYGARENANDLLTSFDDDATYSFEEAFTAEVRPVEIRTEFSISHIGYHGDES